jgi:hypothetical protein
MKEDEVNIPRLAAAIEKPLPYTVHRQYRHFMHTFTVSGMFQLLHPNMEFGKNGTKRKKRKEKKRKIKRKMGPQGDIMVGHDTNKIFYRYVVDNGLILI